MENIDLPKWIVQYVGSDGKRHNFVCRASTKSHAKHLLSETVSDFSIVKQVKKA